MFLVTLQEIIIESPHHLDYSILHTAPSQEPVKLLILPGNRIGS